MFERILVTTDFTEVAERAIATANQLAALCGAEVRVLHVTSKGGPSHPLVPFGAPGAHAGELQTDFIHGEPGPMIVAATRELKPDLVIMGSHGRSRLLHILTGSVIETVIRGVAGTPVLIVSEAADDAG